MSFHGININYLEVNQYIIPPLPKIVTHAYTSSLILRTTCLDLLSIILSYHLLYLVDINLLLTLNTLLDLTYSIETLNYPCMINTPSQMLMAQGIYQSDTLTF